MKNNIHNFKKLRKKLIKSKVIFNARKTIKESKFLSETVKKDFLKWFKYMTRSEIFKIEKAIITIFNEEAYKITDTPYTKVKKYKELENFEKIDFFKKVNTDFLITINESIEYKEKLELLIILDSIEKKQEIKLRNILIKEVIDLKALVIKKDNLFGEIEDDNIDFLFNNYIDLYNLIEKSQILNKESKNNLLDLIDYLNNLKVENKFFLKIKYVLEKENKSYNIFNDKLDKIKIKDLKKLKNIENFESTNFFKNISIEELIILDEILDCEEKYDWLSDIDTLDLDYKEKSKNILIRYIIENKIIKKVQNDWLYKENNNIKNTKVFKKTYEKYQNLCNLVESMVLLNEEVKNDWLYWIIFMSNLEIAIIEKAFKEMKENLNDIKDIYNLWIIEIIILLKSIWYKEKINLISNIKYMKHEEIEELRIDLLEEMNNL